MKPKTANEQLERWKMLFDANQPCKELMDKYTNSIYSSKDEEGDPFDCSDLVIPETKGLIAQALEPHIQAWKDLDSRVVNRDDDHYRSRKKKPEDKLNGDDNEGDIETASEKQNFTINEEEKKDDNYESDNEVVEAPAASDYAGVDWGIHQNRVRLPDFFDYKGERGPPQINENSLENEEETVKQSKRRKVVSLEDPSKLLDYEAELWKIFNEVPLESEIEQSATEGAICCENIMTVNKEIAASLKEYTRADAHSLARLRKKDRHHLPRVRHGIDIPDQVNTNEISSQRSRSIDCATIKFEFWRRNTKRYGLDPNKCEMEFLSTQTLQDVHNAIVDCTEDELFEVGNSSTASSGYFLIEDTFYCTGNVDYVTPLLNWLEKRPTKTSKLPRDFLNLSPNLKQKGMDIELGNIPLRLGIRYVHVCNGDIEISAFASDITVRFHDENIQRKEYPILHDIWTTSTNSTVHGTGTCDACNFSAAVVITIEDELSDGGPTLFCKKCYWKLHASGTHQNNDTSEKDQISTKLRYNNFKVVPISILQNLSKSIGHDEIRTFF